MTTSQPTFANSQSSRISLVLSRFKNYSWLGPVLLFATFTTFYTFPMVLHFTTDVPGVRYEDRMQNLWNFWWIRKALTSGHNPYHTDLLFFPYFYPPNGPLPLYFHTLQFFNGLVTLPLQFIGGVAAAYNATVFLAMFVSGIGTYWLVRRWGGSVLASVLGGAIFAFAPFRMQALQQSITNIQSTEFLPLYALCLTAARRPILSQKKGLAGLWDTLDKRWVAGAMLAFACCVYTDWYNTLYLVTYSIFYIVWRVAVRPFSVGKLGREIAFMTLVAIGVFILTAPMVIPGALQLDNPAFKLSLGYDFETKASAPLPTLFLPGNIVLNFATSWSGYTSLLLVPVALIALWRLKTPQNSWLARSTGFYWLLLTVVAFVMMLGPELKLDETGSTHIPMPYALFRLLPAVSFTRVPVRFIILAMLGLAVTAAFALDWLRSTVKTNSNRWGWIPPRGLPDAVGVAVVVVVLGCLVGETWSPQPMFSTAGKPFLEALKNEPGDFNLLELPITRHYNKDMVRMFNQISHGRPIIGGYVSRPVFDYYRTPDSPFARVADFIVRTEKRTPADIIPTSTTEDDLDNLALLYNYRYVLVYVHEYDDPVQAQAVNAALTEHYGSQQIAYKDNDLVIYRIPDNLVDKMPPSRLDLGSGWGGIENGKNNTRWRWVGANSLFYATVYSSQQATLKLSLSAFAKPRRMQLKLNGQTLAEVSIPPDQSTTLSYDLKLPPGRNQLSMTSLDGDQLPGEVQPGNPDTRHLAFQVYSIQLLNPITNK